MVRPQRPYFSTKNRKCLFHTKNCAPRRYQKKALKGRKKLCQISLLAEQSNSQKPFILVFGSIQCFGWKGSLTQFFFRSFSNFWPKRPSEAQFLLWSSHAQYFWIVPSPGVDFSYVFRSAPSIEIALSIFGVRRCPTLSHKFVAKKLGESAKISYEKSTPGAFTYFT